MPENRIVQICGDYLKRVAVLHGGRVYRRLTWDHVTYDGLDLVWDGPDRILAVACCWDAEAFSRSRQDFLLFTSACSFAGLVKKFHLVLFHDPALGRVLQDWPVGISVSPIALSESERQSPPPVVMQKLASLVFHDIRDLAATSANPPNWRHFLTPERVTARIRTLAKEKDLPSDLDDEVKKLLEMAHGDPAVLADSLHEYLRNRWEVSR